MFCYKREVKMANFGRFEERLKESTPIYINPNSITHVEDMSTKTEEYARVHFSSPANSRNYVVIKGNIDDIIDRLCDPAAN
jgi:hypothetical protein